MSLRKRQHFAWDTSLKVFGGLSWLCLQVKLEEVVSLLDYIWPGPEQEEGRQGTYNEDHMVRDNWWASVTWEDWEGGVREHVDRLMARR